jgi:antitoxin ParD1/3/4
MNINFPSVDENYIKRMVEDGFYSNATELVRDAVRRMREQDGDKPVSEASCGAPGR